MSKSVEFFFDFVSTATYLAYNRLPPLVAEAGGQIEWRPFLLGGVFKATGNSSPITVLAKGEWMFADVQRWADKYDIPFKLNPVFPFNSVTIMRGAIAAQEMGPNVLEPYMAAMFKAVWQDGVDFSKPEGAMQVMTAAGLPADEIAAATQDQSVKDKLRANTEEAVERGAFGAPTFFIDGEMHWGQDRIDFVVDRLKA